MKKQRTNIDWAEHELTIVKNDEILIHHLHKPNTYTNSVKFINTNGILAVTGDYGNWIFCREFHPTGKGHVDDHYWIEKLKIASTQEPYHFYSTTAQENLNEFKAKIIEEGNMTSEIEEWIERLEEHIDDELEYTYILYREKPYGDLDYEELPSCKSLKFWLLYIFDAFEEICERLKIEENK